MAPRKARSYLLISVGVALFMVIIAQGLGVLSSLNYYVNAHIWHTHLPLIRAYTFTANIMFSLFILALLLLREVSEYKGVTRSYVLLVFSMILSMIIVFVLKVVIREPRPGEEYISYTVCQAVMHADYYGFPSGHTARATVLAYFLGSRWRRARPLLWLWATGIALSRLILNAHWLSDVVGAILVGLFTSLLVEALANKLVTIYNRVVDPIPILKIVD